MSPEPWNLLHDGVIVGLERKGDEALVAITAPHLRVRIDGTDGHVTLHLQGVEHLSFRPYSDRWDQADLEDASAIVEARPSIADAEIEGDALVVWGPSGSLRAIYRELAIELDGQPIELAMLRDAAKSYWDEWRASHDVAGAHPLVREALRGAWTAAAMGPLLEAWRAERTSDLADAIEALDRAIHPEPLPDVAEPGDLDGWRARFDRAPGRALDQLVRCAYATFDTLEDEEPDDRSRVGPWLEAVAARNAAWWDALAGALGTLADAPSDPRIGRAVVRMLRSPSDHWFRPDQVSHAAGPTPAPHDQPSFADHALARIDRDGDAGTPALLDHRAEAISVEADSNGAEMASALRTLAEELRRRHPRDRPLSESARTALANRALTR
jgi:hypothetical protein